MATNTILSLTNINGDSFQLETKDVVYFYNNSNTKAVMFFVNGTGQLEKQTLSVASATVQGYATQALFSAADLDGTTIYFNNERVVKIISDGSNCNMIYNTEFNANPNVFSLDDTAENISNTAGTTIPVTDQTTGDIYYINASLIGNVTADDNNSLILSSAIVSDAGVDYVVGDTINLDGGTYTVQSVVEVATTKLVDLDLNAAGTGYVKDDVIVLAGGTSSTKADLTVATVKLVSAAINAAGTGYIPAETITLSGGTATTKAVLTISSTKVVSATINAAGTGGTPGTATVTGTTGTGTKFQASVTIGAGGDIESVDSITVAGSYTANPSNIAQEPVTGGGLSGAKLAVVMGVNATTISNAGSYTVTSTSFTQFSTSGSGTGATFNTGVFGINTFTISEAGVYTVESATFTQFSTTGSGTSATFNNAVWGVNAVTVSDAGNYTIAPANPVEQDTTDGSGADATFTATFSADTVTGSKIMYDGKVNQTFEGLLVEETPSEINSLVNGL